jgi:hypothetical protein
MEKYQKNMKVIDEAFNIVKETSGITDPEEIATTVIKSEEQNYSLFNYVNILTQEIDFLEENNKDLEEEIKSLSVWKFIFPLSIGTLRTKTRSHAANSRRRNRKKKDHSFDR